MLQYDSGEVVVVEPLSCVTLVAQVGWGGVTALNLTDSLKVKGGEWPGVGLMVEGSFG